MARHAIKRLNDLDIKQEITETCYVIAKTQTVESEGIEKHEVYTQEIITLESSPEQRQKIESSSFDANILMSTKNSESKCFIFTGATAAGAIQYSCSECQSKFNTEELAFTHAQRYGNTGMCTKAVCKECDVIFTSEKSFKRHQGFHSLSAIAGKLNYFECQKCMVIYSCQKDLDSHLIQHIANDHYQHKPETNTQLDFCVVLQSDLDWDKGFHCGYCAKRGPKKNINLHLTLFHAYLVCPIDKQEFGRSVGYFVDHMKTKHSEEFGEVILTFPCPYCDEAFPSRAQSKQHSSSCFSKKYKCTHCTKTFALERQLKLHLSAVNGIKNHKCTYCDKSFTNRTERTVSLLIIDPM